jgi:molecular chaperone GrpE
MNKDKKQKSKENEEHEEQENSASQAADQNDESPTMVALTYDEYDALEKEIESLREDVEQQKDGWLRTRADFENYKKRIQRDAERSHQDAMTSVIKAFLSVSDDLERALKKQPESQEVESWVSGIELIHQKLMNQMKNLGVERLDIKPGDEFDPNIHEAITQEENPDFEEGQIIDVIQPGYKISTRIIRPAMVRVAQ